MHLYARITKVDEATGKVYGRAVQEVVDRSGEIFDYETSKPNFEKWSADAHAATDGKSVGNLRAMHGKIAAGKLTEITFNDAEKAIDICAEVVDPIEREKCLKGVYTGFSIGGSYAGPKWDDAINKGVKRYTAQPSEISLVDLPCVPSAMFTVVKADGAEELRKFDAPAAEPVAPVAIVKDYTAEAERLAKHANAADTGNVIRAILGDTVIEKGLWTVSNFAEVLQQLASITEGAEWETQSEGDDSPVPAALRAALKPVAAAFIAMATEEAMEACGGELNETAELAMAAGDDLGKAGARHSGKDKAAIDAIAVHHAAAKRHVDAMSEHIQMLKVGETTQDEVAEKLAKSADDLHKVTAERDGLAKALQTVTAQYAELLTKAAPPKGAARAVTKDDDNGSPMAKIDDSPVLKADGSPDHQATAIKLIKVAHARLN